MAKASDLMRQELEGAARDVALRAYAPYSSFRVGAAVRSADGRIFVGANVENTSFGLTICAERSALSAAVAAGERTLTAIAVACIDAEASDDIRPLLPCGACRQWIVELAPDAAIIIAGVERTFAIADLLPLPFVVRKNS